MIRAASFFQQARAFGFRFFSGVPCSYLKPMINYSIDAPDLEYVGAANEGDAVAIVTGAALGGKPGVVMFQNSGFGNAVNPLTSLNGIFRIPALIIVTWRGEPSGRPDEPQHELMGKITPELFDVLRIPWEFFPHEEDGIEPALAGACHHMARTGLPYGLIMRDGAVAHQPLRSSPRSRPVQATPLPSTPWPERRPTRSDVLRAVQQHARPSDAIVATTGYMGRALYALADRPNQLYMVGSMGCASSLGLGLALAQPHRRIIVLDGDGAALMRLGALATLGCERPPNLLHLLIDNEMHESTGGQATTTGSVDLAAVAHACGYPCVRRASTPEDVASAMNDAAALTFLHIKVRGEEVDKLPRPTLAPWQASERFRVWLHETAPCVRTVG